jgi:4-diphosphocytidyl-2-C-methyl-D-erythritol kinase
MILFPNAKINLGLNVIEKRVDGFHNLESVFAPVELNDVLEIIIDEKKTSQTKPDSSSSPISGRLRGANSPEKIQFSSSGLSIDGNWENNLIVKAYRLLDADFNLPSVKIHLHKIIPMGAGLGGGSSDAAFTLKGLNELFNLKLPEEKLISYAVKLGSDCAFFIRNKSVFASEKGEIFEDLNLDLKNYKILIVWPGIHSSTADAYGGIVPKKTEISIKEILKKDISHWRNELKNDFEEPIFKKYPEIKTVKEKLYEAGAGYASLSGSGSAVYGLFEKEIPRLDWPGNYLIFEE